MEAFDKEQQKSRSIHMITFWVTVSGWIIFIIVHLLA